MCFDLKPQFPPFIFKELLFLAVVNTLLEADLGHSICEIQLNLVIFQSSGTLLIYSTAMSSSCFSDEDFT